MKILIAEDDLTSLKILSTMLSKAGYDVIETKNGLEALEVIKRDNSIKLAIVDWIMPEMTGLELCQEIRKIETDIPPFIIMLTIMSHKDDIVSGLKNGANDYLVKPYHADELHARIEIGKRMILLQTQLHEKVIELENSLEQIKTLQGVLPICANCKSIRDDEGA